MEKTARRCYRWLSPAASNGAASEIIYASLEVKSRQSIGTAVNETKKCVYSITVVLRIPSIPGTQFVIRNISPQKPDRTPMKMPSITPDPDRFAINRIRHLT
jgi:hypothetical protein